MNQYKRNVLLRKVEYLKEKIDTIGRVVSVIPESDPTAINLIQNQLHDLTYEKGDMEFRINVLNRVAFKKELAELVIKDLQEALT